VPIITTTYEGFTYTEPDLPTVCPTCDPKRAYGREVVIVIACNAHMPSVDGIDDLPPGGYLSGSGEANGLDGNAAMCNLLHSTAKGRPKPRKMKRKPKPLEPPPTPHVTTDEWGGC
jgi:hypothetical protein